METLHWSEIYINLKVKYKLNQILILINLMLVNYNMILGKYQIKEVLQNGDINHKEIKKKKFKKKIFSSKFILIKKNYKIQIK